MPDTSDYDGQDMVGQPQERKPPYIFPQKTREELGERGLYRTTHYDSCNGTTCPCFKEGVDREGSLLQAIEKLSIDLEQARLLLIEVQNPGIDIEIVRRERQDAKVSTQTETSQAED